jgi:hypothetical protein
MDHFLRTPAGIVIGWIWIFNGPYAARLMRGRHPDLRVGWSMGPAWWIAFPLVCVASPVYVPYVLWRGTRTAV